jgi:Cupin domain
MAILAAISSPMVISARPIASRREWAAVGILHPGECHCHDKSVSVEVAVVFFAGTDAPLSGYRRAGGSAMKLVESSYRIALEASTILGSRRHTHTGIGSGYLLEGGIDLAVQGQPTRSLKPRDGFQVPAETPHAGGKNGDKKTKLAVTYVVEKGKPLASPA